MDFSIFAKLAEIDLGDYSPKITTLTPGQMESSQLLWASDDRTVSIGLWECTSGTFTADRNNASEFCYFLQGRIVMTHSDGSRRELGPGDSILLPRGWKGTWEIVEHTRKIYAMFPNR